MYFYKKIIFPPPTLLENKIIVSDDEIKMKLERTKIKSYKKFKKCGEKVRTCFPSYLKVTKFEIQKPNH
jgi:hypothetical protein